MDTALIVLVTVVFVTYLVTVVHAATARSLADRGEGERPETHLVTWPRWLLGLLVLLVTLWLLYRAKSVLTPFLLGGLMAYMLNPVVDRLVARGSKRGRAISLVFLLLLVLLLLAAVLIIPAVARETRTLVDSYDTYVPRAHTLVGDLEREAKRWGGRFGIEPEEVQRGLNQVGERAQTWGLGLLPTALGGVPGVLALLLLLVVTPVIAFWLLRDYHRLGGFLLRLLPEPHRASTVEMAGDVNRIVGGFLLGLLIMVVVVAAFSSIVLTVLGVRFSLLLGLLTGLLSSIPYFGFPAAMLIIGATMAATGESSGLIALAIGLHVVGNIGSDYLIYPRVVGGRVGLHPLVVIFALLAGGALLGFFGILLAVPAAGVIKMLLYRFWPDAFDSKGQEAKRRKRRGGGKG